MCVHDTAPLYTGATTTPATQMKTEESVPNLPQGTQLSDRGTSPGLHSNHCDTAPLLGQHMRRFKLHTVNDGRFQKRRRGRGNRPCESSLPQEAQGKARFLEERQDLERLPSGGRTGQSQGHPGPGLAAGWEPGHINTYVEFFELFLNLAVHLNGIKSWMPNRKRFNKQQCSIGPDFWVSGLERGEEFQNPKSWQSEASAQNPSSNASSVSTQTDSYLHIKDHCDI